MPRVGGLAVWAGFLPAAVLAPPSVPGVWPIWMLAWALVVAVSLIDDWHSVHPGYRLGSHLAAAVAVTASTPGALAGPVSWVLVMATALFLVWAANLYNFMDGSDGLAAAMGICGFTAYGIGATYAGAPATVYFALAAATVALLAVNVPPARTFMGDVGAVPMGFLAAAFGLAGWWMGTWPSWFPLLVFLPFVADATLTLAKRLLRGERVWEAHKEHYYQRLHQLGAGHSGTLLCFSVLMVGTTASALVTLATDPGVGWGVTAAWTMGLCALFSGIDYHWRHRTPLLR